MIMSKFVKGMCCGCIQNETKPRKKKNDVIERTVISVISQ